MLLVLEDEVDFPLKSALWSLQELHCSEIQPWNKGNYAHVAAGLVVATSYEIADASFWLQKLGK